LGGNLPDAKLLEEQQAVGVGPVLGELAVGDAQGIGNIPAAADGYDLYSLL
jgi:hypothetical protein